MCMVNWMYSYMIQLSFFCSFVFVFHGGKKIIFPPYQHWGKEKKNTQSNRFRCIIFLGKMWSWWEDLGNDLVKSWTEQDLLWMLFSGNAIPDIGGFFFSGGGAGFCRPLPKIAPIKSSCGGLIRSQSCLKAFYCEFPCSCKWLMLRTLMPAECSWLLCFFYFFVI